MVTVNEILNNISPQQKDIIEELRTLIKKISANAEEKVRDGRIVYAVAGKDFVWINPFTGHVDLDFMCGARLISGDLKGRGKKSQVKHMEITSKTDINATELKQLIEEASKTVC
ncbi:MAG: DUF1801 domain-containing protein [Candidatus Bathyarchaeota archaeon]|nr:DUF1801 domain-containing protein [Candidatus Bathyarchaeum tardum]WGM90143.1 MAG: DUF1801 domain-containing protein [Candidatus Bathyarchaeum tardum]WNZ29725.1 MAG: DUF1801 domain-containing protein [Candidatus Bathyarchaeota archaeon]